MGSLNEPGPNPTATRTLACPAAAETHLGGSLAPLTFEGKFKHSASRSKHLCERTKGQLPCRHLHLIRVQARHRASAEMVRKDVHMGEATPSILNLGSLLRTVTPQRASQRSNGPFMRPTESPITEDLSRERNL